MSETEQRWLERLGLERDPFPEKDPGLDFFARGGREKQLELLADPASLTRPLVAVVGDAGVGKSTLYHTVLRRLPDELDIARIGAGVFLSATALLQALARALDVPVDGDSPRPALRRAVHDHITAERACTVLLVDDAGELEADALDELVQIAELDVGAEVARVRVFLFAMPGIRDALGQAAGAQRVAPLLQEIMIERYGLNELRGYLQYRLVRAGLQGASPFTEDEYAEIFRRSGGIPARANGIAGRMLRERVGAAGPSKRTFWVASGMAAALIASALLVLLLESGDDEVEPSVAATEAALGPGATPPVVEPLPTPSLLEPAAGSGGPAAGGAVAGDSAAGAAISDPIADAGTAARGDDGVRWVDPQAPVTTRSALPAPRGNAAAAAPLSIDDLDPSHYVLQVLVNSSALRARNWMTERDDAAYRLYARERDGARQYVVVYGDYADRRAAMAAAEDLALSAGLDDVPFARAVRDLLAERAR